MRSASVCASCRAAVSALAARKRCCQSKRDSDHKKPCAHKQPHCDGAQARALQPRPATHAKWPSAVAAASARTSAAAPPPLHHLWEHREPTWRAAPTLVFVALRGSSPNGAAASAGALQLPLGRRWTQHMSRGALLSSTKSAGPKSSSSQAVGIRASASCRMASAAPSENPDDNACEPGPTRRRVGRPVPRDPRSQKGDSRCG